MRTDRSDELEQHIKAEQQRVVIGEQARNGDTEAALAALDEWDLREHQEMGPPDVERAQELYRDGKIDEQELELLIESAMQYYPPDGVRENLFNAQKIEPEITPEAFMLRVVLLSAALVLLAVFIVETGWPVDSKIIPL